LDKTKTTTITRTTDEEVDVCPSEGLEWRWKIHWMNECEYLMILDADLSTKPDKIYKLGDTIKVKILQVFSDKYDWEAWYKGYYLKGYNYRFKYRQ
jgi:hypothetical protein